MADLEFDDVLEYMQAAEQVRPVVQQAVNILLSYGPELGRLLEPMRSAIAESRIRSVHQYKAAGFTRPEALDMAALDAEALMKAAQNAQASIKKKK